MSIIDYILRRKKVQPTGILRNYSGKVIAKSIAECDLDAYMWNDRNTRPDCCPICHNTLRKLINHDFSVNMKNKDIGITWDGYTIISENFKNFCIEGNYKNLRIEPLKCKGLYYFEPMTIFGLDYERYGTKFIDKRGCCGSYDEIIRPPIMKSKDFVIQDDNFIMRSEYMFGSYDHKSVITIVGVDTAKKMKEYGLNGLFFNDIYDSEDLKITETIVNKKIYD